HDRGRGGGTRRLPVRGRGPRDHRTGPEPGRRDPGMSAPVEPVNPEALVAPRGYSHGMKGRGEVLFVAGQIGWDREGRMVAGGFVAQFAQALENGLAVVRGARRGPAARP